MALAPIETSTKGAAKGAAAEGAARGRENADRILRHLRDHGPASAPAIGMAVGLSAVSVGGHLRRMAGEGLVTKSGTRWSLTPTGTARTGPSTGRAELADVLALLPSEAHQAMACLMLDAVIARSRPDAAGVTGWPSFGLYGAPGTGKTTVPRVLARLLGLADVEAVRVASDLDRAELLGRRVPDGKGGYRFAPAAALGRPLLCLDELDKVRGDGRLDALRLLQGDGAITLEGETFALRPVVVATFNAGARPDDVLPSDRLRRMVLCRTDGLVSAAQVARSARRLFDGAPLPVLDLSALGSPGDGAAGAELLIDELPRYLIPGTRERYPGHALSLLVGGRMAIDDCGAEAAAERIARDYLTCAATWGETTPALVARFDRRTGGGAPEPRDDEGAAHGAEVSERAERVMLAEAKAIGAKVIAAEVRGLGATDDEEGTRLRAGLAEVSRQLKAARTMTEAESVSRVFDELHERAERRAKQIEARRWVAAERPRRAGTRGVVPGRLATLEALAARGHRTAPGPVLESLGLVVSEPLPTGGQRWHGAAPGETWGAVVFEDTAWHDLAVVAILAHALAVERGLRPAVRPALLA